MICQNPDKHILSCINTGYELFKSFKVKLYTTDIKAEFKNTDSTNSIFQSNTQS